MTDDILARFLGRTAPEEFESEDEILQYFQAVRAGEIFPNEEIDEAEAERACRLVLAAWRRAQEHK